MYSESIPTTNGTPLTNRLIDPVNDEDMKNSIYLFLLAGLVLTGLATCKKNGGFDTDGTNPPEVRLILDTLRPDLNVADNIPLVCVVFSDLGLESVRLLLVKTTGTEEYKEYTTFKDPNQYSVKELPLWAEDFVAFTIIATDKAGRSVEQSIPISAIPFQAPPVILFDMENVVIDENKPGAEVPVTKFSVQSAGRLSSVAVRLFTAAGVTNLPLSHPLEEGADRYEFEELIPYKEGDVALQVTATDEYNKVKIETLPITYIQLPPPVITFAADSVFITDVGGTANVRLQITSVAGITSVAVTKMKQATVGTALPPVLYDSQQELSFTQDVTIEDNVSALRIVATDRLGRTATVNMSCEAGFETRVFTLGSDFYNRGILEEPDILPFYSISLNKSMTIGEAYQKIKDIEMYVLWFAAANGYAGDRGLRLMGPKNTVSLAASESYYHGGTYTWQVQSYTFPSMVPAANWSNRNQTTFIKIGVTTNSATIAPFNYDNVTIHDLRNYGTAITGDRMPFLIEGDMCLLKLDPNASNVGFVGATTGVSSKVCILKVLKIENETRPVNFFTNPWPTAPNVRKIAKVTFGLKIPK